MTMETQYSRNDLYRMRTYGEERLAACDTCIKNITGKVLVAASIPNGPTILLKNFVDRELESDVERKYVLTNLQRIFPDSLVRMDFDIDYDGEDDHYITIDWTR